MGASSALPSRNFPSEATKALLYGWLSSVDQPPGFLHTRREGTHRSPPPRVLLRIIILFHHHLLLLLFLSLIQTCALELTGWCEGIETVVHTKEESCSYGRGLSCASSSWGIDGSPTRIIFGTLFQGGVKKGRGDNDKDKEWTTAIVFLRRVNRTLRTLSASSRGKLETTHSQLETPRAWWLNQSSPRVGGGSSASRRKGKNLPNGKKTN